MLTPLPEQNLPDSSGSSKKIKFLCSCGNEHECRWSHYATGRAKSCGKCKIRRLNDFVLNKRFGELQLADGQTIKKTAEKLLWVCSCGRTKTILVNSVLRGYTRSCGECNRVYLSPGQAVGEFVYEGPTISTFPKSSAVGKFRCNCGRVTSLSFGKAQTQKTCGHCNVMPKGWWEKETFGKLRAAAPAEMSKHSIAKVDWLCSCGRMKPIRVDHVVRGSVQSCGECRASVVEWHQKNFDTLSNLTFPASPDAIPSGGVVPLETIKNNSLPFSAQCSLCGTGYKPRFSDIKRGLSLTCGCSSSRISSMNVEMAEFIRSCGKEAILEHKIKGSAYDLFVPSKNLLIEMHGLKWHCMPGSKARDLAKYETARKLGYGYMVVFEDEWTRKQTIVKEIVRSRIGVSVAQRLRPSQCQIEHVNSRSVADLLDECHYLGACSSSINLAVMFEGAVIGAMCVRKPSRKTKAALEISRMVMRPEFRVHGIWSKMAKVLRSTVRGLDIVTYSDNRLFTGEVYGKMGFELDGVVSPDYFWVKNSQRFHKSALRKPSGCIATEFALRTSEGYTKVWDLGKKRWIMRGTDAETF